MMSGGYFIFYLLTLLTGNPLLFLIVLLLLTGLLDRQFFGFFPDLTHYFKREKEIRRLSRVIAINPNDVSAQLSLGRAYIQNGKTEKAIPHLEAAFPRMREMPEALFYLGRAYLKTGRREEGKNLLLEALRIDTRILYGEGHLRLGEAYLEEKEYQKAATCFESFCMIHTSSSEGYYQMALAQAGLGKVEEARKSFQRAIEVFRISPRFKKRLDRKWAWKARRALTTL